MSAPPAVAQLAVGTQIEATVVAARDDGLAILNSLLGQLKVQSKLPLPEDVTLRLQVLRVAPLVEFLLKGIDGKSGGPAAPSNPLLADPSGGVSQSVSQLATFGPTQSPGNSVSRAAETAASAGQRTTAITPISIDAGSTVAGVFVRTFGGSPSPNAGGALQESGVSLAANSPVPIATGHAAPDIATSQRILPQDGPGAGKSSSAATGAPVPGTEVKLRVLAVGGLSDSAAIKMMEPQSGASAVIEGVVTGATPAGLTLIRTDTGTLALATENAIPVGQRISFEVLAQSPPATMTSGGGQGLEDLFAARSWPALEAALTSLQQSSTTTAQQVSATTIPRADGQLSAALLFFLSALRGGDVRSWIGDGALRLLERDRGDIAGRLSEDFGQLSRAFNEPGSGEWRTALVPWFDGQRLDQVRMHFHGRNRDQEDGEPNRFIIDVELSRLGRIQLDGLVNAKEKRFDLILRTARPLASSNRRDIYDIYAGAIEATGVSGNLVFQADATFVDIDVLTGRAVEKSGLIV